MHQIEEILKKLNEKSAVIQPGTVQLLTEIQDRLMNRDSGSAPAKEATDAAAPPPRKDPSPTRDEGTAAGSMVASHWTGSGNADRIPSVEELSPLVRSIVDSNRKWRGDQQQPAVSQPRFLSGSRLEGQDIAHRVAASQVASGNESGSSSVDLGLTAFPETYQARGDYQTYIVDHQKGPSPTRGRDPWKYASAAMGITPEAEWEEATHDVSLRGEPSVLDSGLDWPGQEWNHDQSVLEKDDLSAVPTQEAVSLKFPGTEENAIQDTALPPPVPHFDRPRQRPQMVQTADVEESESRLPIFDSVWFRKNAPTSEITRIVDQMIRKVPPVAPATIQFTHALESRAQGQVLTTQIAWELSRRTDGDVLLVDADFMKREISRQLNNVYTTGLSDMLNLRQSSVELIRKTGVDRLFWLASGQSDVSFRNTDASSWSRISAELKQRFQYICIYSGAAEEKVASTWGRYCDFTFLMVNLLDDLGPATREVLDHLRHKDCRVAGLITIE